MPVYPKLSEKTRWEMYKKHSAWHFDYTKPPIPGEDSFLHVCRFEVDFSDAISAAISRDKQSNLIGKDFTGDIKKDWSKFSSTEVDLALVKANPYVEHFEKHDGEKIDLFEKIADELGMIHRIINFNNQRPSQMLPNHFDTFQVLKQTMPDVYSGHDLYATPKKYRRFVIMLEDWKLGQFFQIGNATWHQWRAGECITWEWQDMPHCTGNAGYWDRYMLQITGTTTDKTQELLAKASKDLVIKM